MVDRLQLHDLLRQLVAVDSVNPTLVPGARGEAAAAEFLREWLKGQGIEARLQEAAPGRPNVVAWLGPQPAQPTGEKPRAALAILAHIDTVGAGDMANPFTGAARWTSRAESRPCALRQLRRNATPRSSLGRC